MEKMFNIDSFESKEEFENWVTLAHDVKNIDYVNFLDREVALVEYFEKVSDDLRLTHPLDVLMERSLYRELNYRGSIEGFKERSEYDAGHAEHLVENGMVECYNKQEGLTVWTLRAITVAKVKGHNLFFVTIEKQYEPSETRFYTCNPQWLFEHEIKGLDFSGELELPSFKVKAMTQGRDHFYSKSIGGSCTNLFGEEYCGCTLSGVEVSEEVLVAYCQGRLLARVRGSESLDICYAERRYKYEG